MILIAMAVLPVFILLVVTEWLWRSNRLRGESARKLIHIIVGTYVAFWPFFISFHTIQLISLAFLVVVAVSQRLDIFKAIHGVARQTWGEVLFAAGIGLSALFATTPWIFAACVLFMSVADGFAALSGKRWGKGNRYQVFRHEKSVIGTTVFWLIGLLITALVITKEPGLHSAAVGLLLFLPLLASLVENMGVNGTDNVFVPLLVVTTLNALLVVS